MIQIIGGENGITCSEKWEQLAKENEQITCVGDCEKCPADKNCGDHVKVGDGVLVFVDFKKLFQ